MTRRPTEAAYLPLAAMLALLALVAWAVIGGAR